ncbi:MAG: hypothetical protein K5641_01130 [Lachnospiraceae bacterium]|nr:hypothetical protein [Lachnospiraceae bacterium]
MKRFLALTAAVVLAMSVSMTAFAASSPSSGGGSSHHHSSSHSGGGSSAPASTTSASTGQVKGVSASADEAVAATYGVAQAVVGADGSATPAKIASTTCPDETKTVLWGAAATFKLTPVDSFVFSMVDGDPAAQITTAMSAANLPANCQFMVFDCFGNLTVVTPIINENGTATVTLPATCVITVCTK